MVMGELEQETEVLVIGAGPGGYAAAFRAADLGKEVTLVDIGARPGGVCLFRGCIPSKTYLFLSELLTDARRASDMGITFSEPAVDIEKMRLWKNRVVERLANGLVGLTDKRGIQLLNGRAEFTDARHVRVHGSEVSRLRFRKAIIATGSHPIAIPGHPFKRGGRVMNSNGALELPDIPQTLLVVGGGYVGLELGSFYAALGSRVTVAEMGGRLLPQVDADLVKPLHRRLEKDLASLVLNTRVASMSESDNGVDVTLASEIASETRRFDRVLVAIGRKPNTDGLGLDKTGVMLTEEGFIGVDSRQRTTDANIFAVGDVVGGVMLAHKATREGKIAAEVIAGEPSAFDVQAMPAVIYTDPQIAWCGVTEQEAAAAGRAVAVHRFPWTASGRALTMGAAEGLTKIIADPESRRIIGVGITGRDTEGLISEGVLAVEMGALVEDVALTVHPHPTLSETEGEAAELFMGTATHIISKQKKPSTPCRT
jgi:dihydrolipoamide dehydrogenase